MEELNLTQPEKSNQPYYQCYFDYQEEAIIFCVHKQNNCSKKCKWWLLCLVKDNAL